MAADIIDLKDRMKNTADKKTVAEKVQDLKELRSTRVDLPLPVPPMIPMVEPFFAEKVMSERLGAPVPA